MRPRNVWIISKRIFRQLKNDKRTLSMILSFPIIAMSLYIVTFAGEPVHIKTIVVDRDKSSFTLAIVNSLDKKVLDIAHNEDLDEAKSAVTNGEARAVIFFERDFTRHFIRNCQSVIREFSENGTFPMNASTDIVPTLAYMITDNSDVQVAKAVVSLVNIATEAVVEEKYKIRLPILMQEVTVYSEKIRPIDAFLPGCLGLVTTMTSFALTVASIVRERVNGTLERLMVIVGPSEIIIGHILAFNLINILQVCMLLFFALAAFNVLIVGNLALVFLILFLLSIGFQGLGVLVSTIAKSEFEALQFIPHIMYFCIILANVFWPIESVMIEIRPLSYFIPLTYAVDALKAVMIRGWDFTRVPVVLDTLALTAFALVMICLSIHALKRR